MSLQEHKPPLVYGSACDFTQTNPVYDLVDVQVLSNLERFAVQSISCDCFVDALGELRTIPCVPK